MKLKLIGQQGRQIIFQIDLIVNVDNLSSFWDDWMRLPEQRHDRACIRPEISRTAMSPDGKKGVSQ